jgi:hypothetical protein
MKQAAKKISVLSLLPVGCLLFGNGYNKICYKSCAASSSNVTSRKFAHELTFKQFKTIFTDQPTLFMT